MLIKSVISFFFALLLLSGCHSDKTMVKTAAQLKQIEVAPELVECMGVGPMQCLSVREVGQNPWQLHYSSIEGFSFEPGYIYTLTINETRLETKQLPADASAIQWSLVEIVAKQPVDNQPVE